MRLIQIGTCWRCKIDTGFSIKQNTKYTCIMSILIACWNVDNLNVLDYIKYMIQMDFAFYFDFLNVGSRQFKIMFCSSHFSSHYVSVGLRWPYGTSTVAEVFRFPTSSPSSPHRFPQRSHTRLDFLSHRTPAADSTAQVPFPLRQWFKRQRSVDHRHHP